MSIPLQVRKALKSGFVTTGRGKTKKISWSNKKAFDEITPDEALTAIRGCMRSRIPFPMVFLTSARLSPDFTDAEAGRIASCGYTTPFWSEDVIDDKGDTVIDDKGNAIKAWHYGTPEDPDIIVNIGTGEIAIHATHVAPQRHCSIDPRFFVLPENDPISVLRRYGFTVGLRDPRINPDDAGRWMVTEASLKNIEDGECSPDHCFSIVGDDIHELASEARDHFELEHGYAYVVVKMSDIPNLMHEGIKAKSPDGDFWPEYQFIDGALSDGKEVSEDVLKKATEARVFGHSTPAGARSEMAFVDDMCVLRVPAMRGQWKTLLGDTSMNKDRMYLMRDISAEDLSYSDIRLPGIDNKYEPLANHVERMEKKESLESAGGIKPVSVPQR